MDVSHTYWNDTFFGRTIHDAGVYLRKKRCRKELTETAKEDDFQSLLRMVRNCRYDPEMVGIMPYAESLLTDAVKREIANYLEISTVYRKKDVRLQTFVYHLLCECKSDTDVESLLWQVCETEMQECPDCRFLTKLGKLALERRLAIAPDIEQCAKHASQQELQRLMGR